MLVLTDPVELEKLVKSKPIAVIAFTSTTCPACMLYRPVLEEASKILRNRRDIAIAEYLVDYDPEPALQLGITGTPTTVVYVNGEPREGFIGYIDLEDLLEYIDTITKRYAKDTRQQRSHRL